jgi:hypothetical protein
MRPIRFAASVMLASALLTPSVLLAQRQGGPPPRPARESAPIDVTGYWVSYVTEDWRYRMVTPPKGDYRRVPVTTAALPIINGWDPAADERAGNQCKSYGAAALLRVPGRLHITWEDADTMRLDADAGTQTRRFRFGTDAGAAGAPSWQGHSVARWDRAAAPNAGGSLRVVTTNLRAGYLRKNGVPYSEKTTVTEDFDVAPLPGGGQMLVVTAVVDDPVYLARPFVVSSHFKKEADGSKWDPTPCSSSW